MDTVYRPLWFFVNDLFSTNVPVAPCDMSAGNIQIISVILSCHLQTYKRPILPSRKDAIACCPPNMLRNAPKLWHLTIFFMTIRRVARRCCAIAASFRRATIVFKVIPHRICAHAASLIRCRMWITTLLLASFSPRAASPGFAEVRAKEKHASLAAATIGLRWSSFCSCVSRRCNNEALCGTLTTADVWTFQRSWVSGPLRRREIGILSMSATSRDLLACACKARFVYCSNSSKRKNDWCYYSERSSTQQLEVYLPLLLKREVYRCIIGRKLTINMSSYISIHLF